MESATATTDTDDADETRDTDTDTTLAGISAELEVIKAKLDRHANMALVMFSCTVFIIVLYRTGGSVTPPVT